MIATFWWEKRDNRPSDYSRKYGIQLNLSTTAILGTEESDLCKDVLEESIYGFFVPWDEKKWPLAEVLLYMERKVVTLAARGPHRKELTHILNT